MLFRRSFFAKGVIASLVLVCFAFRAEAASITVAAAASLKDALAEIQPELEKSLPGIKLVITSGASGTLSQQILQGAPVDLFLSAASKPMVLLQKEQAIISDSRQIFLTNDLILIAPEQNPLKLKTFADLKADRVKRIAIGEPRSVPAGEYARQVLKHYNLEAPLAAKYIFAKDVRQVLAYVERGEADAGFVYASDLFAQSKGKVATIARAPEDSHEPIVYEMAIVKTTKAKAETQRVWQYLQSKEAEKVWLKFGFNGPKTKLNHAAL